MENNEIKLIICPCNFYDDAGNLVHTEGEHITVEELDICKKYYITQKNEIVENEDTENITKKM